MIHYQSGELNAVLNDLHAKQLTGLVKITTAAQPVRTRWLMLKNGAPTFCGAAIPSAQDFVLYLSRRLQQGRMEASIQRLLKQHPQISSVSEFLSMLTRLRLLKWEDIETLVSMDTAMYLDGVMALAGTLSLEFEEGDDPSPFDLCFGRSRHALDWGRIWTLMKVRQKMWQRISSCIKSPDSVPLLVPGALETVKDIAARNHLMTWVDGTRSLGAIAQAVGEDPIFLGRNYMTWVERGWIKFADSTVLHSPILLSIHNQAKTPSILKRFLAKRYQMRCVQSVIEAFITMHMYDVGLALIDVDCPDIDSLNLCQRIRQTAKFMNLPLILLATHESTQTIQKELPGPTHMFKNPPEQEALAKVIDQYVYPEKSGCHYVSRPLMTRKASEFLANVMMEGIASHRHWA